MAASSGRHHKAGRNPSMKKGGEHHGGGNRRQEGEGGKAESYRSPVLTALGPVSIHPTTCGPVHSNVRERGSKKRKLAARKKKIAPKKIGIIRRTLISNHTIPPEEWMKMIEKVALVRALRKKKKRPTCSAARKTASGNGKNLQERTELNDASSPPEKKTGCRHINAGARRKEHEKTWA